MRSVRTSSGYLPTRTNRPPLYSLHSVCQRCVAVLVCSFCDGSQCHGINQRRACEYCSGGGCARFARRTRRAACSSSKRRRGMCPRRSCLSRDGGSDESCSNPELFSDPKTPASVSGPRTRSLQTFLSRYLPRPQRANAIADISQFLLTPCAPIAENVIEVRTGGVSLVVPPGTPRTLDRGMLLLPFRESRFSTSMSGLSY